jgi:pimeloyl-ACP methyl ester carboxylesterase/DNA-binding CsgD family transcriptional regulator
MHELRLFQHEGRRVAAAVIGSGPVLVLPPWWITHLEGDLADARKGVFLRALARSHTVVRYDRPGTGVSDRDGPLAGRELADEVALLVRVLDELEVESARFLGISCGGCVAAAFAAAHPERVEALAVYAGYVDGRQLGGARLGRTVTELVRSHWGMGSRLLTDLFLPGATGEERQAFARLQRSGADAETAALLLEEIYGFDLSGVLDRVPPGVRVVHRAGDRVVPLEAGCELAAGLRGSRLVTLRGDRHLPWDGDASDVLGALASFLGGVTVLESAIVSEPALTARENELLVLVAEGLTDADIAARLFLSPHTVHRHLANIRAKLGLSTRAAVGAYAVRRGIVQ